MIKNELKSLVEEMCTSINSLMNAKEEITKENLSDFLVNSATLISDASQDELNSYQKSKDILIKEFKGISQRCLTSYEESNSKFSELSKMHADTLIEFKNNRIDIPKITNKFTEIQTHMIDEIQRANSIISELTQQVESLEKKSTIDSLTKVYNRGALNTYLSDLCLNANKNYSTYMIILDIDDFKKINDSFGHVAGDKILIFISNILKKTLRDGDKIFRYGGEEFIIILNRIDNEHCEKITHRLLQLVSQNKLIYKGENLQVTMSIGATVYTPNDTPDTLITRADQALYKAKANGKNRMYSEVIDGV